MKINLNTIKVVVLAFVLAFSLQYAAAQTSQSWQPPTQAPPQGNTAAPINVSSVGQTKVGNLIINGLNSQGAAYTNGLIVANGRVGIGDTSPDYKLEVNGMTRIQGSSVGNATVALSLGADVDIASGPGTDIEMGFLNSDDTVLKRVFKISPPTEANPEGKVGIGLDLVAPTATLDVGGTVRIRGGAPGQNKVLTAIGTSGNAVWQTAPSSDISLKKNVRPLTDSLSKILRLGGVSFNWKNPEDTSTQIGFIAQDVEKVFPEVVHIEGDGTKSVDYQKLVAPLVEAVKSQQSQIESLKAEIEALKKAR